MPKAMRVYYDTEFLEDGKTIDLISIGMVREDGKEFYAVSSEFDTARVATDDWLMSNVMNGIDHEPLFNEDATKPYDLKITDEALMRRVDIRDGITYFLSDIWPEFWAWYGAYDHIALVQLWGKMIDLPNRMPMFTCDIKQLDKELGGVGFPSQVGGNHNALNDARHNIIKYNAMMEVKNARYSKRAN